MAIGTGGAGGSGGGAGPDGGFGGGGESAVSGSGGGGGYSGGGGGGSDRVSCPADGGGGGGSFNAGTNQINIGGVQAGNGQVVLSFVSAPSITTSATPTATVGQPIRDTATISGLAGSGPFGTITFTAHLNDATCGVAPAFTDTKVAVNGSVDSDLFGASPGTYTWKIDYSGNADDAPVVQCGGPDETSTVEKKSPTIVTQAQPNATIGEPISDVASVLNQFNATGTVSFAAYGPDDTNCTGAPAFAADQPLPPAGSVNSGPFVPSQPGTYRWTATYNGDANNNAATSPCNTPDEASTVAKATPTISTTASPSVARAAR